MKKAIATPAGQPTKYVDLTQEEVSARIADEAMVEAKGITNAPYVRLTEIDAELSTKMPRMMEDLSNSVAFHPSVQTLLDEKAAIRLSLS